MANLGGSPTRSLPPRSLPVSSTLAAWSRDTESRSNTGLAWGWSPILVWSPVRHRMLSMPSMAALRRSDCRAMRFRSRQVSWKMGFRPASFSTLQVAKEPKRITEDWLSVTLTKWTPERYSLASSTMPSI